MSWKMTACWLVFLALSGFACQKQGDTDTPVSKSDKTPKNQPVPAKLVLKASLQQSFEEATVSEPPVGVNRPADKTVGGKLVGPMYERIVGTKDRPGLWSEIRFQSPQGQRIDYRAVVKTDLGDIHLELWPDIAPNHVRNFIALANVGYYEGLAFDRTIATKFEGQPWECLEAGCPLGTGEAGHGSIGYWLKPEITDKVSHDVGMIGAVHGESVDSAACKFYVTLSKAPWMDGGFTLFGKISRGLEVAQAILRRPVHMSEIPGEPGDRPVQPVLIRKVLIETQESATPPQVALNP